MLKLYHSLDIHVDELEIGTAKTNELIVREHSRATSTPSLALLYR